MRTGDVPKSVRTRPSGGGHVCVTKPCHSVLAGNLQAFAIAPLLSPRRRSERQLGSLDEYLLTNDNRFANIHSAPNQPVQQGTTTLRLPCVLPLPVLTPLFLPPCNRPLSLVPVC